MANILIVDDEVGMREGCRRALVRHGHQVLTAENGADALRLLRDQAFDLLLLDIMMPGVGGLEVLERAQERDANTVCVMITGYATVDLAAQAMKKGAQGFLPKPFTTDDLLHAVQSGLDERERRLTLRRQVDADEDARQQERARQEQSRLNAMQSRFMLVVVHELRNPAGVIKNYLQMMRGGYVDAGEWDQTLARLDDRASQLLDMLDDLLELAHLREIQAPPRAAAASLADLLAQVVERLRPQAKTRDLALSLEIDARPSLPIQPAHFQSLATHLLDNAIRYTPAGSVRVRLAERAGSAEVSVTDTGIGLSAEEMARVFDEFYRTEAGRAVAPLGTGLGLSIVAEIARLYGGSIQTDSAVSQGTAIAVAFPLLPPAPSGPA